MVSDLLSAKQRQVLKVIDRFGLLSLRQLSDCLKGEISTPSIYSTKKLTENIGFIRFEKIGIHGMVSIAPKGTHYLDSSLPKITKINYKELNHTLQLNDVLLMFIEEAKKNGKEYAFETERELRKVFLNNLPKEDRRNSSILSQIPNRIPDFVWWEDGARTAYEIELNSKSTGRYHRKLELYKNALTEGIYTHICYIAGNEEIRNKVTAIAEEINIPPEKLSVKLLKNSISSTD